VSANNFLRLSQYRAIWRLRAFAERQRFQLLSRVFRIRYFAREERANTGILVSFLSLTAWQLLLAVFIAGVLELLELALVPELIDRWPVPDSANYVVWLSTTAQIGGVFIALYFTAVTAAAGAIYAQVPNNVRDLLARERVGNIYIRYLTLATFIPLCLIALHLGGFEPLRLAIPLLVVISGTGIIAFAALGRRAFNLFDPTKLAGSLFWELGRWLATVSAGGFRWQDRSFQSHSHRQATAVTETLNTLADLASTHANLDSAPLLELSLRIVVFLAEYQRRKLRIPTDSLWFEQKYEHKAWYVTDDTATTMAHTSGVSLSPAAVPTYNWLETRLEAGPLKCFELNAAGKRLDNLQDLLQSIDAYVTALAANGNLLGATSFIGKVQNIYEQATSGSSTSEEEARRVAITDAICSLHLRPLLAYRIALEQRTPDLIMQRLERVQWSHGESLYKNGFVTPELRQLEWLLPRIQMEIEAEGLVLTPVWYARDLILKSQAEDLDQSIAAVLGSGTALSAWSDRLVKSGFIWQSAAVLSRYLEYLSKLDSHLPYLGARVKELQVAKRLTDLPWPDLKPDSWLQDAGKQRRELARTIAGHITLLSGLKQREDVPDYRGQFIHETGENLFNALLAREADDAMALMPHYLTGSLSLFEELRPPQNKAFDAWAEQKFQIAAAPIIDVLELSGHAKLLAEFYGDKQIWSAIRSAWDVLLQTNPAMVTWLAAIMRGGLPRFQIPHRGLVRTNWSMRVQRVLNKLPQRNTMHGGPGGFFGAASVVHPSTLVRYCATYKFHDGRNIFAALYLSELPGGRGLEWGHGVRDLKRSLELEEERYHGEDQEIPEAEELNEVAEVDRVEQVNEAEELNETKEGNETQE